MLPAQQQAPYFQPRFPGPLPTIRLAPRRIGNGDGSQSSLKPQKLERVRAGVFGVDGGRARFSCAPLTVVATHFLRCPMSGLSLRGKLAGKKRKRDETTQDGYKPGKTATGGCDSGGDERIGVYGSGAHHKDRHW